MIKISSNRPAGLLALCIAALAACTGAGTPTSDSTAPASSARHPFVRAARGSARHQRIARSHPRLRHEANIRQLRGSRFDKSAGADSVILDVRDLDIKSVTDAAGAPLGFTARAGAAISSDAPLAIALPATGDTIVVDYQTSPQRQRCSGWRRADRRRQAAVPVHSGSGDSHAHVGADAGRPGNPADLRRDRARVPAGMRAVMSAEHVGTDGETGTRNGLSVYRFRMTHPDSAVPDCARGRRHRVPRDRQEHRCIRGAVGGRARGRRVRRSGQDDRRRPRKLYGPYRWGRYDILVLPPSFPFGGMENPHADVRDADGPRGRPFAREPRRARARAFMVGQSRDERDVERLLAQRGLHDLHRVADHGGAARQAVRRHAAPARPAGHASAQSPSSGDRVARHPVAARSHRQGS